MNQTQLTTMDNGVRVTTRTKTGAASAVFGLWLQHGWRDETKEQAGWTHLWEHTLMAAILDQHRHPNPMLDSGCRINGQSDREFTALYGQCLGENLAGILQHITGVCMQPDWHAERIATEHRVLAREAAWMSHHASGDASILPEVWPDHPLSQYPRIPQHIPSIETLKRFHRDLLQGVKLHVVAVGDVNHRQVVEAFARLRHVPAGQLVSGSPPVYRPQHRCFTSEEQTAQLAWFFPGVSAADPLCAGYAFLQTLFRHPVAGLGNYLRRHAEVYATNCHWVTFRDCGYLLLEAQCSPEDRRRCQYAFDDYMAGVLDQLQHGELWQTILTTLRAEQHMVADDLQDTMEHLAKDSMYLGDVPANEGCFTKLGHIPRTKWMYHFQAMLHQSSVFCWEPSTPGHPQQYSAAL